MDNFIRLIRWLFPVMLFLQQNSHISGRGSEIIVIKNTSLIDQLGGRKVVCTFNAIYYNDEQFSPEKIDPWKCTHINYQFAHLNDETFQIVPGHKKLDIDRKFYEKTTDLKKQAEGLKVYLSLGGWKDSTVKYSQLVKSESKRRNFITHVIKFLKEHNFDGLDIAWEYPNGCKGAIGSTPEDKTNYPIFLKELKGAFVPENLELSASVASIKREIEAAYDVPVVANAVNHLNVMTFDMHGLWEGKTGHHAEYSGHSTGSNNINMVTAMKEWVQRGANKNKLNIGIPAYGRTFKLKNKSDTGYGAKIISAGERGPSTKTIGYLAYNEICDFIHNRNWTKVLDYRRGPYAYGNNNTTWVAYDSPEQVIYKTKHVIDEGYGGILVKDISSDDYIGGCFSKKYPLLYEIIQEILRCEKKKKDN